MNTRAQTIVAALFRNVDTTLARQLDEGNAKQLSGMLLRHGLLQVVAFLRRPRKDGKPEAADQKLVRLLEDAMREALGKDFPEFALSIEFLSQQHARILLFLNELALEVAQWIERVVEARKEKP